MGGGSCLSVIAEHEPPQYTARGPLTNHHHPCRANRLGSDTDLPHGRLRRSELPTSRFSDNGPPRWKRVICYVGRLGRWTLVVVTVLLALIGFLHLTRGTAVRHAR